MSHPPIQVYLCVKGGREAIAFYEKAFGAKETFSMPTEDGKRLMHATLACFGSEIMLQDDFPEHEGDVSALTDGRKPGLAVNINMPTPADVDVAVRRAEAAGAVVTMPVADQFWGARYGARPQSVRACLGVQRGATEVGSRLAQTGKVFLQTERVS